MIYCVELSSLRKWGVWDNGIKSRQSFYQLDILHTVTIQYYKIRINKHILITSFMKLRLKSKLHSPKAHDMPLAFNNLTIDILIQPTRYTVCMWVVDNWIACKLHNWPIWTDLLHVANQNPYCSGVAKGGGRPPPPPIAKKPILWKRLNPYRNLGGGYTLHPRSWNWLSMSRLRKTTINSTGGTWFVK